jgi:Leucine-rich repeat (LRR) protein
MKKEALKRIFDFLKEKGEHRTPLKFKLLNNIPLTEEDLNIEGILDLSFSSIKSLPEGLKVGGTLSLEYSTVQTLPEGLKVGSTLDLEHSRITNLPKGLEVGEHLYIKNTQLIKYTDKELREMIKPGFIKGKIHRIW